MNSKLIYQAKHTFYTQLQDNNYACIMGLSIN